MAGSSPLAQHQAWQSSGCWQGSTRLFLLLSESAAVGAPGSHDGERRNGGEEDRRRGTEGATCPWAPGPGRTPQGRCLPSTHLTGTHEKASAKCLSKEADETIAADPPQDDAVTINTHDNLRPKRCYNTNCPWKLTCSKAAEFSFDRPGSGVPAWLQMTEDIHASKISGNAWRDFAHCRKTAEIWESWLFVRKQKGPRGWHFSEHLSKPTSALPHLIKHVPCLSSLLLYLQSNINHARLREHWIFPAKETFLLKFHYICWFWFNWTVFSPFCLNLASARTCNFLV